jgi:hypothetical protein
MGLSEYPPVMAGYAASERIERASPQFVGLGSSIGGSLQAGAGPASTRVVMAAFDADVVDRASSATIGARLASRLSDLHETWAQMTFFLFDPESWR